MTRVRRRWLRKRRRKGLARPRPLRLAQCNAMGVTASPARTARIIRDAASTADVLTMCEVANVDVAAVLGGGWQVAQDRSTWARAGCAVAIRRDRGRIIRWRLRLGVPAFFRGRRANRMQDRYLLRAVVRVDPGTRRRWTLRIAAGHAPPKRNWSIWWPAWITVARSMRVHVVGGDWNRLARAVRPAMGRKVRMRGIDGYAVRRWLPMTAVTARDVGSDHRLIETVLWPRNSKG